MNNIVIFTIRRDIVVSIDDYTINSEAIERHNVGDEINVILFQLQDSNLQTFSHCTLFYGVML